MHTPFITEVEGGGGLRQRQPMEQPWCLSYSSCFSNSSFIPASSSSSAYGGIWCVMGELWNVKRSNQYTSLVRGKGHQNLECTHQGSHVRRLERRRGTQCGGQCPRSARHWEAVILPSKAGSANHLHGNQHARSTHLARKCPINACRHHR